MAKHAMVSSPAPAAAPLPPSPDGDSGSLPLPLPVAERCLPTLANWLDWQCRMVSSTLQGELHLCVDGPGGFRPALTWPAERAAEPALATLTRQAAEEGRRLILTAWSSGETSVTGDVIACPVLRSGPIAGMASGAVAGVVVLVLKSRNELQVRAVAQLLEWGIAWLESLLVDLPDTGTNGLTAQVALDPLQALLSAPSLSTGAHEFCNHLARQYGIDRVSLGLHQSMRMIVQAVSGDAVTSTPSALSQTIESAMTEAADQEFTSPYPVAGQPGLAHRSLLRQHGMTTAVTLPLRINHTLVGAVTLESATLTRIPESTIRSLMDMAPLLASTLELLVGRERSLVHRLRPWLPTNVRTRLVLTCVTLLLVTVCLLPATLRIGGPATIEGIGQRAIAARLDGIIASAPARAGDELPAGAVLATLEDQDLSIQQARWSSERDRHAKEYGDALVRRERAGAGIARAHMQQAEAELALITAQIERATLRAPFAGVIVSGDYSQLLGTPIERGQVMFEIAPAGTHRVIVEVDERDIGAITLNANGHLRLTGMPNERLAIQVTRIDPVASAADGNNRFRVEARLNVSQTAIRPGMQGVARFDAGTHPLIWTWMHDLVAGVRIWFWRMGL